MAFLASEFLTCFYKKACSKKSNQFLLKKIWSGTLSGNCLHKVSWKEVCLPKSEGGLGLKDLIEWNNSAIYFQLWRITQPTSRSIWITWFKSTFLRRRDFWLLKASSCISWSIRQILIARTEVSRFIQYNVGSNSSFFLWQDPWVLQRPLLDFIDHRTVSILHSNDQAKVNTIIHNGTWNLHPSNRTLAMDFLDLVSNIRIHQHDHLLWDGTQANRVKLSDIWNSSRTISNGEQWLKIVWHPMASFCGLLSKIGSLQMIVC
ncbi:uncharacterized protein LOC141679691 [Apium graveolens]|uniref:uncharacterized protein LOC141679691 n=1 Tax=Apium graveolens TaxID=4045 RepID=UPI003D7B2A9C